jgi:hypothetical protein
MKLVFFGDLSANDRCLDLLEHSDAEEIVKPLKPITESTDYTIANLESCWNDNGRLDPVGRKTHIATQLSSIEILEAIGISAVSSANNHSFDFGHEGWMRLKEECETKNIQVFGAGDQTEGRQPAIFESGTTRVAILGYAAPDCGAIFSSPNTQGAAIFEIESAAEDILKAKQTGCHVVVCIHWGEERINQPSPLQRLWAKQIIEAGADLIIGHHAHVMQGAEQIDGKWVFYSLGNFFMGNIYEEGKLKTKYVSPNFVNAAPLFEFSKNGIELKHVFGMRNTSRGFKMIPAKRFQNVWKKRCSVFGVDNYQDSFTKHQDFMWRFYIPFRYRLMAEPLKLLKRLNFARLKRLAGIGESPWKDHSSES